MEPGECLTRGTVWLALSLYVGSETVKSFARGRERSDKPADGASPPHPSLSPAGGEGVRRPGEGVVQESRARTTSWESLRVARWLNTVGCAAFLAHVAAAFHYYHQWSHAVAYADTVRQTAEFSGWNWGGGLYINYVFALVWLGETVWSWVSPTSYLHRTNWITWIVRGFFLFMMFNGAVVFVRSGMKWFGLILCLALLICWWRKRMVDPPDLSKPT